MAEQRLYANEAIYSSAEESDEGPDRHRLANRPNEVNNKRMALRTLQLVTDQLKGIFEARGNRMALVYRQDARRLSEATAVLQEANNIRPTNNFVWDEESSLTETTRYIRLLLEITARLSNRMSDDMPVNDGADRHQ